ncbi:MAG: DUF1816 domain-containing protein [Cyanobacteria bacterium P01_E01_bin.6]
MNIPGITRFDFLLARKNRLAWWVEIHTRVPNYIYYFGPFENQKEANSYKSGYVDDLVQEKAYGISVAIKQCEPKALSIDMEN